MQTHPAPASSTPAAQQPQHAGAGSGETEAAASRPAAADRGERRRGGRATAALEAKWRHPGAGAERTIHSSGRNSTPSALSPNQPTDIYCSSSSVLKPARLRRSSTRASPSYLSTPCRSTGVVQSGYGPLCGCCRGPVPAGAARVDSQPVSSG